MMPCADLQEACWKRSSNIAGKSWQTRWLGALARRRAGEQMPSSARDSRRNRLAHARTPAHPDASIGALGLHAQMNTSLVCPSSVATCDGWISCGGGSGAGGGAALLALPALSSACPARRSAASLRSSTVCLSSSRSFVISSRGVSTEKSTSVDAFSCRTGHGGGGLGSLQHAALSPPGWAPHQLF
jgi:hypothetical protein